MNLTLSPKAITAWMKLSELERIRVELALNRMRFARRTVSLGAFDVTSYDLLISGEIIDRNETVLLRNVVRVSPTPKRPSRSGTKRISQSWAAARKTAPTPKRISQSATAAPKAPPASHKA
jgi:hypothetical protein